MKHRFVDLNDNEISVSEWAALTGHFWGRVIRKNNLIDDKGASIWVITMWTGLDDELAGVKPWGTVVVDAVDDGDDPPHAGVRYVVQEYSTKREATEGHPGAVRRVAFKYSITE